MLGQFLVLQKDEGASKPDYRRHAVGEDFCLFREPGP